MLSATSIATHREGRHWNLTSSASLAQNILKFVRVPRSDLNSRLKPYVKSLTMLTRVNPGDCHPKRCASIIGLLLRKISLQRTRGTSPVVYRSDDRGRYGWKPFELQYLHGNDYPYLKVYDLSLRSIKRNTDRKMRTAYNAEYMSYHVRRLWNENRDGSPLYQYLEIRLIKCWFTLDTPSSRIGNPDSNRTKPVECR